MSTVDRVIVKETRRTSTYEREGVETEYEYSKWQYVAIMDDGTEEVIRKSATRRYLNAYMYYPGDWSFGKAPQSHRTTPKVFKVQDALRG